MGIFVHSATDTNTTGAGRDMIACCNYDLIREIVTIPQTNNTTIFLLYIQTKLPGESSQGWRDKSGDTARSNHCDIRPSTLPLG